MVSNFRIIREQAVLRPFNRLCYFIASLLLLSACSTSPDLTLTQSQWLAHQQQLQQLQHWRVQGKVALIGKDQRQSLNLVWQQQDQHSQINLSGPLGVSAVQLNYQPGQVSLQTADGETYQGNNAQRLLEQLTGWSIPIEQLPAWLKGEPAGADYQLNPENRLASIEHPLWQISYPSYSEFSPYILPRQISLQNSQLKIKLNIHRWSFYD